MDVSCITLPGITQVVSATVGGPRSRQVPVPRRHANPRRARAGRRAGGVPGEASPRDPRGEGGANRSEWLSADAAAEYLGLPSRRALYQAVRRGQVPARRLGPRRLRFSRADLDGVLGREHMSQPAVGCELTPVCPRR
jgi:excisionase family DNA binding protein